MGEQIIETNGVQICTESFSSPSNPALLLINGATQSMVYWDTAFCEQLADKGMFVIRYDNRDVGRSTVYELGKSNYSVKDMANDGINVLNSYHIDKANVMGMSLGGMIAQVLTHHYPDRVLSLTLLSTSLFGGENSSLDLPPMDSRILEHHAQGQNVDWSNKEEVEKYLVEGGKLLSGSKYGYEEQRIRKQAREEFDRANNLTSMFNHASLTGDDYYNDKIKAIQVPTLIVHGTDDLVLPYEHGLALKNEIPNSEMLALEGSGHEFHTKEWPKIIDAIKNHVVKE
ncbi:alpha/beta fold macrolide esterase [Staphylococcus arlettae]|uniref:alpha/beta fold hydrolase n=1 Tax=Staphylococcus arlettae TaxID=29378 RepID=UPI002DBE8C30|nr:alpha/beta hydrolase [Staphylococcus arlettae]MEB6066384.1 alpha/beta fold hydrolase [Staphylococcus arlettae]